MKSPGGVPEDIGDAARLIRSLLSKPVLVRAEREKLNLAKLKIAYWACANEDLPASRENLTIVLGADSKEILGIFDKAMGHDKDTSKSRKSGPGFWEDI